NEQPQAMVAPPHTDDCSLNSLAWARCSLSVAVREAKRPRARRVSRARAKHQPLLEELRARARRGTSDRNAGQGTRILLNRLRISAAWKVELHERKRPGSRSPLNAQVERE